MTPLWCTRANVCTTPRPPLARPLLPGLLRHSRGNDFSNLSHECALLLLLRYTHHKFTACGLRSSCGAVTEEAIVAELTRVAATDWKAPVDVVSLLSSDNFDEFVEAQKTAPILFYTTK